MVEKSCLPDMPESIEAEVAYSLIIESMKIEYKRLNSGIFSSKIIEPLFFLFFGSCIHFLCFTSEAEGVEHVLFILAANVLILYIIYTLKEDLATLRQAHLAKLLGEVDPLILKNICENRFEEVKEEINYSVFFHLKGEDIAEHLKILNQHLKWRSRLILWLARYLTLSVGAFFLSRKFFNDSGFWVVIGLMILCITHIYVLYRLGKSPALLKRSLMFAGNCFVFFSV